MKNFTVLISSAERNMRSAIRRAVEPSRFPIVVDETDGSAKAVERSTLRSYDVIIIDVDEPSGMENLERILRRRSGATILVAASCSRLEEALQAVRLGASDVLEKPATPAEIAAVIETALALRANIVRGIFRSIGGIGARVRRSRSISGIDRAPTGQHAAPAPELIGPGALRANPDPNGTSYSYLECMEHATTAMKRCDEGAARRWIRAGLSIDTERPEAYNLLGVVSEVRQDQEQAMKFYRASVALDPTYQPARNNLHRLSGLKDGGRRDLGIVLSVENASRE